MAKQKAIPTSKGHRFFVTIADEDKWKTILEIVEKSEKYKSVNSVINEALSYGLPFLIKGTTGETVISDDLKDNMELIVNDGEVSERMLNGIVVRLLKEINLNVLMCKSMSSQLVNAIGDTAEGKRIIPEKYKQGAYSDTPEYLESYEMRELKKLRR
ncbi:MAG: hypothetical protein LUD27_06575 [Clostridia bacterium]|nr:hypothetical protein [Clostridia bacterium]